MIALLLVVAVGLVGVASRLVLRVALTPRLRLRSHLRQIGDYGFQTSYEDVDLALAERLRRSGRDGARRIGAWLIGHVPSLTPLSTAQLNAAGYFDADREVVHGYRAYAAVGLPALVGLLVAFGTGPSPLGLLAVVICFAGGWVAPSAIVRRRGDSRLREVDRHLPELIDLLIATIEAGMSFSASLGLVAERLKGPLGDELRLTMRQQSLGMSTSAALDEMVLRCDTPSIRAFVRTATRGETLGMSIGPALRELSADQRRRHRMAARETMQKAPIKLIFPLMFLIMPALMIVLFYPAVYGLKTALSGVF